ncbi:hypothetical protein BO71DRAFT_414369 [Aspergillus ellipticus CBS 707.79]|uniref:Uncharacterized protein n=1 Tax=Aspergillus ellipticus CBS 707.79 TaxID=1448320 RepID=A0A319CRW4_9EURO|nr:hypothetical protein BO71DRAFT_414369 [Aspergillus ellipticus CBS 707.79]
MLGLPQLLLRVTPLLSSKSWVFGFPCPHCSSTGIPSRSRVDSSTQNILPDRHFGAADGSDAGTALLGSVSSHAKLANARCKRGSKTTTLSDGRESLSDIGTNLCPYSIPY